MPIILTCHCRFDPEDLAANAMETLRTDRAGVAGRRLRGDGPRGGA
jgi:hypothetical protein